MIGSIDDIPWEGIKYYRVPEWEPDARRAGANFAILSKVDLEAAKDKRPDLFFGYRAAILYGLANGGVEAIR